MISLPMMPMKQDTQTRGVITLPHCLGHTVYKEKCFIQLFPKTRSALVNVIDRPDEVYPVQRLQWVRHGVPPSVNGVPDHLFLPKVDMLFPLLLLPFHMNCTFSPGHREVTSTFPWTDNCILVRKFSLDHETLLVFAITVCRVPDSLSNHSKKQHSRYFCGNFPIKHTIKSFFFLSHTELPLLLAFQYYLIFHPHPTHIIPVLSCLLHQKRLPGAQDENCRLLCLKKFLKAESPQSGRCLSSAARTGELVQQESSKVPKRKYEIR